MAVSEDLVAELAAALKAADSILWMAERYAEAGGTYSIEMEEYEVAEKAIHAALAKAGVCCRPNPSGD